MDEKDVISPFEEPELVNVFVDPPAADPSDEAPTVIQAAQPPDGQGIAQPDSRRTVRHRRVRGALQFYAVFLGIVFGVLVLLCCLMVPLRTLLTQYENARPQKAAEEVYQLLFAQPDWALLYEMAGAEDTDYENREQYVTYMTEKVAGRPLEYRQIPSGDTDSRKYGVILEDETVASFTVRQLDDSESTFARWTLGEVEVYFTREVSVTVNIMPGCTVYINGIPLDESHTVLKVSTPAEDYLPDGLHGYRYEQQQLHGLLIEPEVLVLDQNFDRLSVTRDPVTGIYSVPITDTVPIDPVKTQVVLDAAKAEALYAIRAISLTELREYFQTGSQAYDTVRAVAQLAKNYKSYSFDEDSCTVSDFYAYSNDVFSARYSIRLDVKDKKGKVNSFTFTGTYFFAPNNEGNFMVTDLVTVDTQHKLLSAPFAFTHNGSLLETLWVSSDGTPVTAPVLDQTVVSWNRADTGEAVLLPAGDGTWLLAEGVEPEAMTLVPVFADPEAQP